MLPGAFLSTVSNFPIDELSCRLVGDRVNPFDVDPHDRLLALLPDRADLVVGSGGRLLVLHRLFGVPHQVREASALPVFFHPSALFVFLFSLLNFSVAGFAHFSSLLPSIVYYGTNRIVVKGKPIWFEKQRNDGDSFCVGGGFFAIAPRSGLLLAGLYGAFKRVQVQV